MVQPNWPSEDDPDYTPDFEERDSSILDPDDPERTFEPPSDRDLEELREDLRDLVDEE